MDDTEDLFQNIRNKSAMYIRQFIEANMPDVNIINPAGLTALHFAAEYPDNVEVVKVLVSMGANVNYKGQGGLSPLHTAVIFGSVEIAKILISHGANVNAKEDNGFTPLHTAAIAKNTAAGRNIEIAKILASNGAYINTRSNINEKGESYTPLALAKQMGDTAMVQYLVGIEDEFEKHNKEAERKRHEEQERQAKEKTEAERAILKIIDDLTEKIQLNPKEATTYNFRGLAYTQKGDMNQAFEDFNQAIQLNPNYAEAYCNRGGIYVYKDNFDMAITDFNKAILLNPNDDNAYFCRGSVYSDKKGDHNRAIADFENSLRINPNNAFARQFLEQARKLKKEADERERQAKEQERRKVKEKKNRLFWIAFIALCAIIVSLVFMLNNDSKSDSSHENSAEYDVHKIQEGKILTDSRDGKNYKTIIIGKQTWLAKNMNYNAKGSVCYDNEPANCAKYGRHYNWNAALKACPKGWHLPANAEWDKLYRFADGTSGTDSPYESPDAGKRLKAKSSWNDFNGSSGNGLDVYGFTALPGGSHYAGKFHLAGDNGYWWSASESDDGNAYYRFMLSESGRAGWNNKAKSLSLNVRCVMD